MSRGPGGGGRGGGGGGGGSPQGHLVATELLSEGCHSFLATLLSCRHHEVGSAGEDVHWSLQWGCVTVAPVRLTNFHLSENVSIHSVMVSVYPEPE